MIKIYTICALSFISMTAFSRALPFTIPFTSTTSFGDTSVAAVTPALKNFGSSTSSNRVFLQWNVDGNQAADQFEIEKSRDGKNFVVVALVFGTDLPDNGNYWFYEKKSRKKMYYRVRMITRDKRFTYSPVITVNRMN